MGCSFERIIVNLLKLNWKIVLLKITLLGDPSFMNKVFIVSMIVLVRSAAWYLRHREACAKLVSQRHNISLHTDFRGFHFDNWEFQRSLKFANLKCPVTIAMQRVPALRGFWDLEKTPSRKIRDFLPLYALVVYIPTVPVMWNFAKFCIKAIFFNPQNARTQCMFNMKYLFILFGMSNVLD